MLENQKPNWTESGLTPIQEQAAILLASGETITAEYDAPAEGFYVDTEKSVLSKTADADSLKNVLEVYYARNIYTVKTEGKKVAHETTRSVSVYLSLYILIIIVTTILISFNGFDFTTNFTSVLATVNNTGPGFSMVGSAGNYSEFSVFSKLVFCFNMLAGRLELYPLVLILIPAAWKKN